jgi:hypothetical protein
MTFISKREPLMRVLDVYLKLDATLKHRQSPATAPGFVLVKQVNCTFVLVKEVNSTPRSSTVKLPQLLQVLSLLALLVPKVQILTPLRPVSLAVTLASLAPVP